ncbi:MAG TPA: FxLYD domain-containing protein, partial [Chitinophagaceae bacterium]
LTRENPVWLFALMGALIFGAFVVKQMVEVLGTRTVASTDFSAIAAPIGAVAEDKVPDRPMDIAYQNALHKQVVAEKTEKVILKPKVKDLRKQVKISGTDYKVGVLGGINNLDLTVSNNSLHPLERVVIEVKYFKANGKTVSTEEYNLFNVAPGTERKLEVPNNKRGVSVKYRIVGVESRKYKAALREV